MLLFRNHCHKQSAKTFTAMYSCKHVSLISEHRRCVTIINLLFVFSDFVSLHWKMSFSFLLSKIFLTLILLSHHLSSPDPSLSSVSPAPLFAAVSPPVYDGTLQQPPPSLSVDLPTDPPATHDGPCDT